MFIAPDSGLIFRPFLATDFDAVRELYRIVWGEQRQSRYDYMRWVETIDGLSIATVAMDGNVCVGFYMVWPQPVTDGTSAVSAGQPIDTMTDPAYRSRGLFSQLAIQCYRLCSNRGLKILFGAPNPAALPGNVGRLNWAVPTSIQVHLRPITLAGVAPFGKAVGLLSRAFPLQRSGVYDVLAERPPSAALDQCLMAVPAPRGRWSLARSVSWYSYRYQDAGHFDYRWVSVYRAGALTGFAILGVPSRTLAGIRRGTIADVVGVDTQSRAAAVGGALKMARDAGLHLVVAKSTLGSDTSPLRSNGFVPVRRTPLIARTLGPDCFDANPFRADSWSLFGGDFDTL